MEPLSARIQLVEAEAERLTRYFATLPAAAWHHPSACTLWEVGDVLAHLTLGAQAYITWITRGLQGETAPLPGATPAGMDAANAARRAQRARDVRMQLGAGLFANFQEHTQRFNALLAGLAPMDWATLCYHPTRLRPAADFVAMRLGELVLHGWDIRSRLEATAPLPAACLPVCLELLPDMCVWAFRPGALLPTPVRCSLLGLDHAPHPYDLVSTGQHVQLVPRSAAPAQIVCQCDMETLVLLMSGRLSMPAARDAGRLTLAGEQELCSLLMQWFRGN